jgi:hypothetical protein
MGPATSESRNSVQIQTSVGSGPKPSPRSFGEGRLLLMVPKREQTGTAYESKDPQQEIVCDVIVLPDPTRPQPPVIFGGKMRLDGSMSEPDTHRVDVGPQGWLCPDVIISAKSLVPTLRRVLDSTTTTGTQQAIVGRLWRDHSKEARGAWKISGEGHEATPAEVEVAAQWYAAASTGTFTNSAVVPLAPIPAQPAQGYQPAPAAPVAQQGGYVPAPQGYQQPPAAAPVQPQYGQAPQGQQFPANGGYPPAPPAYGGVQTPPANGGFPYGQQPPAAPVPQSAPPVQADATPPGINPEVWASWDAAQRQGFYNYQAQQQAQYAAATGGMNAPTPY